MRQVLVNMCSRQQEDAAFTVESHLASGNTAVKQRPEEHVRARDWDKEQLRPKPTVFVSTVQAQDK